MGNSRFLSIPFVWPAIILAVGLILSALVGAGAFYKVRTLDNVLSVTGSAKTHVVSDSVKWTFNISRQVTEDGLPGGYSALARDLAAVKNFLTQNGVLESEITINPIGMEEIWKGPDYYGPRQVNLRQLIVVQSAEVAKISDLAKTTEVLGRNGVFISYSNLEYFYSKLAELRVSLLADAIKDAKARAHEIANSSDQKVGSLKAASSGVVQVLAPNSVEIADYGAYDTSSIEKDVMVTVRATFFVK